MKIRTAVAATAGLAVLTAGGVVAGSSVAASASTPASPPTARHHRLLDPQQRAELRRTGHVTVVRHTRRQGDVTVLVQRGVITAVSPTSISLQSRDGYPHTYVLGDRTRIVEKRARVTVADLHVGERAMVIAVRGTAGDLARSVSCLRPAGPHPSETPAA